MYFGAGLPIIAMNDVVALRDFSQALDGAGFDLLTSAGHVLGVPAERYTDRPQATYTGPFHDPFVAFGYLAAMTQRIHFRPTILILPLYPTAIVAKQSAELQYLSNGRFELGIGISWNAAEYQALGQDFSTRGRRLEEQVVVLRKLWTEPYVTFSGKWHRLEGVGLNRAAAPIPIWIGGSDDRVLRRAARVADGFMPLGDPFSVIPVVQGYVREAGRDVASFGFSGRVLAGPGGAAEWVETARKLQAIGVNQLNLATPPDLQGEAALKRLIEARNVLAGELD
ncbi:MAG: TIGR03619 family F420-dependent LLM class oxidoreductase [Chloroflexi bacterium]|nr:TIGR03619 family F420-dependent LLM class oxidoreductase [Chloroflexota bacterium]